MTKVRDLLDREAPRAVVGRDRELETLAGCLEPGGPVVTFLHGIPGIGKSALLQAFVPGARASGAAVLTLDGQAIEPSETGFLEHLADTLGADAVSLDALSDRIARAGETVVLVVDTFERLRLLESWLRRTFVPALPDNVRLILASRYPPATPWLTEPGWQPLVRAMELEPIPEEAAGELLSSMGVEGTQARRIQDFARGHPLSLKMAAATAVREPEIFFGDAGASRVVQELSRRFLEGIDDSETREALIAASAVRRTTVSILEACFGPERARSLHERLAALPFVYAGPDGLVLHDAVREAMAAATRAQDPDRYRRYRRAAWKRLTSEVDEAGRSELWRYTADMLYLIENPIVREAFFPSGAQELTVEPAPDDALDAVLEIVARHEGDEAVDLVRYAWRIRRRRFHVVLDRRADVAGFYFMLPADEAVAMPQDPVCRAWLDHLSDGGPEPRRTLFIRRWLSREDGESPSPVQAACWLDIKRTYMEMRPELRRVYLTVRDPEPYARAAGQLGFQVAPGLERTVDGRAYRTAWLDFGPRSVDGWLRGLAAAELGIEAEEPGLLDHAAKELRLADRRVPLSPREFDVLSLLVRRVGEAVSRDEILEAAWDPREVESNVVDSVVYSLRRKMGEEARRLETVRGFGYRLERS